MTKRLYHVSYHAPSEPGERPSVFTPRIPLQVAPGEDKTIPRVCLTGSVDDCLLANPYTDTIFIPDGHLERHEMTLHRLERDGDEFYGVPFLVYAFDVDERDLVCPEDLDGLVPDAADTDEHWATRPVTPVRVTPYLLEDAYVAERHLRTFYRAMTDAELASLVPVDENGVALV